MDIAYLKEYITLSDRKNYQAAATALGISASSLTRHIQALEQETGKELISRNTHSLSLTKAGEVFLRYARTIVGLQESLMHDYTSLEKSKSKNLAIGIPLNHSESDFEDFIIAFHEAHPDIYVDFSAFPPRKLFQYLMQGDLDLVLSHEFDSDDSSLVYIPFTDDELYIHISEGNPLYDVDTIDHSLLKEQRVYMRYNLQSSFAKYMNLIFSKLDINVELLDLMGKWPQNNSQALFMTAGNKIDSIKHSGNVRIMPLEPPIIFTYGIYFPQDEVLSEEADTFIKFCQKYSAEQGLLSRTENPLTKAITSQPDKELPSQESQ